MTNLISKDTVIKLAQAHREVEAAEKLLAELNNAKQWRSEPDLRDVFGRRHRNFELGVPNGDNGHRLYGVSPELAKYMIEAHLANKRAELIEACQIARMELDGMLPASQPATTETV